MAERSKQPTERVPRAMIHKNILDVAEDDPQASIEAIADEIGGATPDLVANVLEEYGDPAADDTGDSTSDSGAERDPDSTMSTNDSTQTVSPDDHTDETEDSAESPTDSEARDESPENDTSADGSSSESAPDESRSKGVPDDIDKESLTDGQVETLRAIARHPEATQQELADELDVVRATISNRVNDIDGFDWQHRRSFVEAFFDTVPEPVSDEHSKGEPTDDGEPEEPQSDGGHTTSSVAASESDEDSVETRSTAGTVEDSEQVSDAMADDRAALSTRLEEVESTLAALEATVEESEAERATDDDTDPDPELLQKAAQAVLDDDRISEAEGMAILRHLL